MRHLVVLAITTAMSQPAMADAPLPNIPVELSTDGKLSTDGGTELSLPAGWWIVPPASWESLDAELRSAQDTVTMLSAQNDSLKKSADAPDVSWYAMAGALVIGAVIGAWAI